MVYALIGSGSHKRNSLSHPVRVGKPQEGRFQVKRVPILACDGIYLRFSTREALVQTWPASGRPESYLTLPSLLFRVPR